MNILIENKIYGEYYSLLTLITKYGKTNIKDIDKFITLRINGSHYAVRFNPHVSIVLFICIVPLGLRLGYVCRYLCS